MRNLVVARESVAQAAGAEVLAAGGNALDAVVAGAVAGATVASSASLLGGGGVLLAGPGVGAWFVDARPRAPGLGEKRPKTPDPAPPSWTGVVPGLLGGLVAAHNRFGGMSLSALVRTVVAVVKESEPEEPVKVRLKLLQQFGRLGLLGLERAGVANGILRAAGAVAGGTFTPDDLAPVPPTIDEARVVEGDGHEVLLPPAPPPTPRHPPAPLPELVTEAVVAADLHGVTACATWVVAPPSVALPEVDGLSLAALVARGEKGVPRWRPGATLPLPLPVALVRTEGRVLLGLGVTGEGALEGARDRALRERLSSVGFTTGLEAPGEATVRRGVALWMLREAGDELRGTLAEL